MKTRNSPVDEVAEPYANIAITAWTMLLVFS